MSSHYIKILSNVEEYAKKIDPAPLNWRQTIFDDITEMGKQVTFLEIENYSGRPAVSLYGNIFYCEAGIDKYRDDTILVYRVESADSDMCLPKKQPQKVSGSFLLLLQHESPERKFDSINQFFKEDPFVQNAESNSNTLTTDSKIQISTKTFSFLKKSTQIQRSEWHPRPPVSLIDTFDDSLALMRNMWRLFQLEKHADASPRQKAVLEKMITPKLVTDEFISLLNIFNISLLNSISQEPSVNREYFFKLLELMKDLPLSETIRAYIWFAMVEGLDSIELRRELKDIAPKLYLDNSENGNSWKTHIIKACNKVGKNCNDASLLEMIDEAETSESPIQFIIQWTERIQFDAPSKKEKCKIDPDKDNLDEKAPLDVNGEKNTKANSSTINDIYRGVSKAEIEKWVIRIRTSGLDTAGKIKEIIENDYRLFIDGIEDINTVHDIECLVKLFQQFTDSLRKHANLLPDPVLLEKDLKEAVSCIEKVNSTLNENVKRLMDIGVTPRDILEISDILKIYETLPSLPEWIWEDFDEDINEAISTNDIYVKLSNPIIRNRIKTFFPDYEHITSRDPEYFNEVPPPNTKDIADYLELLIQEWKRFSATIEKHEAVHHKWIRKALSAGVHEDEIENYVELLEEIELNANEGVFQEIVEKIGKLSVEDDREKALFSYKEALQFYKEHFGNPQNATLEALENWILKNENKIGIVPRETPNKEIDFALQHNLVDHPSRRVPLVYFDYKTTDAQYGFVLVPVLFSTKNIPRDLNLTLKYEISTSLRQGWPSNWEDPWPDTISIMSSQWRQQNELYVFSFKVRIPLRKPKSVNPRTKLSPTKLSLRIMADDEDKMSEMNIRKSIHWEQIEVGTDKGIQLKWPDGVNTGYVDNHPIGPQEHVSSIESRVLSGSSFAAVAPRRFGKTTLAQYLRERADKLKYVIPEPALCTNMCDGQPTVKHNKIWAWFSKKLVESLGSPIDYEEAEELPDSKAFDHVRLAAKREGKNGILLLIDESQLFFPKENGPILGTKLKDVLELHWSRTNDEKMVPVYFGLIGLPGMLERMGVNLHGFLMPIDIRAFKEVNLNKLIYTFTRKQLHTTREAREELSIKAGNLYILKTLLLEITEHINDDNRNWTALADVQEIVGALKERLVGLREPGLGFYLRDVLNEAEDITVWKPRSCYPLAIALAKAYSENLKVITSIKNRAMDLLNLWCLNAGFEGSNKLVYTSDRIDEHLQTLIEIGFLNRRFGFEFDIHEAWLLGLSKQFPADEYDREALFRGALKMIRLPEGRERIHAGSQAQIFRFSEDQTNYALRTVVLNKQKDRKRFHETLGILETLKKQTELRAPGSEYIYNLKDVGIADKQDEDYQGMIGAEIYQWIDGICLEEKVAKLSSQMIASIGLKLSHALRFIHEHEIFHRDICPRNIVLEKNSANPILIDFGLARYSKYEMHTVLGSDYTAPEIFGDNPKWSSAADVFALGKTLNKLLSPNKQHDKMLISLLEKCTNKKMNKRPNASDLVDEFERMLPELHIAQKHESVWTNITNKCKAEMSMDWYANVLKKFKPRFIALAMGLHDEMFDRCAEVAQLLDFILEAFPNNDPLKLSYVLNKETEVTGDKLLLKNCIRFMSHLRVERSHYDPKKDRVRILQRFKNPNDSEMKSWANESGILIGECLQLKSLSKIVGNLLED
jgi:serine/threonine protein kinase